MGKGLAKFMWYVGQVTEALDLMWCLYDALPWEVRKKLWVRRPPPQDAIRLLWENFDKWDPALALENMAKNFAEDLVFGISGQLGNAAYQEAMSALGWQRPLGAQSGPAIGKEFGFQFNPEADDEGAGWQFQPLYEGSLVTPYDLGRFLAGVYQQPTNRRKGRQAAG